MIKLMEKKPVLHAVLWIVFYIVLVNIGDAMSEQIHKPHLITGIILFVMAVLLIAYMNKTKTLKVYGLQKNLIGLSPKVLYFVPLVMLGLIQFFGGIDRSLSIFDMAVICFLMIGTGVVEEIIFRGFLFRGILEKSGVNRAILISGITFGIGHIVNLFSGYGTTEQVGQIIVAVIIGVVLARIVVITKSLVPGMLFHIMFNIGGAITYQDNGAQMVMLLAILGIALSYSLYLKKLNVLPA